MLISALFSISKKWKKQTKCSAADEWIHSMGCYSNLKMNEILSFVTKGVEVEIIMLSESRLAQKDDNYINSSTCEIYKT